VMLQNAGSSWAYANEAGNAVEGRFYGPNHASCSLPNNMTNCIFLPASGFRVYGTGELGWRGIAGLYWSSTQCDVANSYALLFVSDNSVSQFVLKMNGNSIRCVK